MKAKDLAFYGISLFSLSLFMLIPLTGFGATEVTNSSSQFGMVLIEATEHLMRNLR